MLICETYEGLVPIDKTEKTKYLGFVLSSRGDNMVNIKAMKDKSIGTIRKIFTRLDSLNLKKYYFEVGRLFLHIMLRSSILYACETYYNLKEAQIRQLEMIEEGYLRKLFKTSKGCPLSQIYLEGGVIPARYEIKKIKLLFLKNILSENQDSLIYRFLMLQFENPTRGDWASSCMKDMKDLNIEMSIEEIKQLTYNQFRNRIKHSIEQCAFKYLIAKRGSKGQEIIYSEIKMAEYLMPNIENLSIDDKRSIFEIRNRMVSAVPANFSSRKSEKKHICPCGETEEMEHLYTCKFWNNEEIIKTEYKAIYEDNIKQQLNVSKILRNVLEKREIYRSEIIEKEKEVKENAQAILFVDPLSSLFENCFGNK